MSAIVTRKSPRLERIQEHVDAADEGDGTIEGLDEISDWVRKAGLELELCRDFSGLQLRFKRLQECAESQGRKDEKEEGKRHVMELGWKRLHEERKKFQEELHIQTAMLEKQRNAIDEQMRGKVHAIEQEQETLQRERQMFQEHMQMEKVQLEQQRSEIEAQGCKAMEVLKELQNQEEQLHVQRKAMMTKREWSRLAEEMQAQREQLDPETHREPCSIDQDFKMQFAQMDLQRKELEEERRFLQTQRKQLQAEAQKQQTGPQRRDSVCRASMRITGHALDFLKVSTFAVWRQVSVEATKQRATARKASVTMSIKADCLTVSFIFAAWAHIALQSKKELQRHKVRRVSMRMTNHILSFLMVSVLAAWKQARIEVSKQRETARRASVQMSINADHMIRSLVFATWVHVTRESKKELRRQTVRRASMRMTDHSLSCLMVSVLAAWRMVKIEALKQRETGRRSSVKMSIDVDRFTGSFILATWANLTRESKRKLRRQTARRVSIRMADHAVSFLMVSVLAAWRQAVAWGQVRVEASKQLETARRASAAMSINVDHLCQSLVFARWAHLAHEIKKALRRQTVRRALMRMTDHVISFLMLSVLTAWKQLRIEVSIQRERARRASLKMSISADHLTGSLILATWAHLTRESRKEWRRQTVHRISLRMANRSVSLLMVGILAAWWQRHRREIVYRVSNKTLSNLSTHMQQTMVALVLLTWTRVTQSLSEMASQRQTEFHKQQQYLNAIKDQLAARELILRNSEADHKIAAEQLRKQQEEVENQREMQKLEWARLQAAESKLSDTRDEGQRLAEGLEVVQEELLMERRTIEIARQRMLAEEHQRQQEVEALQKELEIQKARTQELTNQVNVLRTHYGKNTNMATRDSHDALTSSPGVNEGTLEEQVAVWEDHVQRMKVVDDLARLCEGLALNVRQKLQIDTTEEPQGHILDASQAQKLGASRPSIKGASAPQSVPSQPSTPGTKSPKSKMANTLVVEQPQNKTNPSERRLSSSKGFTSLKYTLERKAQKAGSSKVDGGHSPPKKPRNVAGSENISRNPNNSGRDPSPLTNYDMYLAPCARSELAAAKRKH